ncbi:hypothetical protein [Fictibacillus phosphorivorans]|uniref:hypothetical protein n=1 Tax=Fictibacillus phosphorivorans TaxID=1221500 RepID=UPI0012C7391C|nr:hypothetical protein [Fictibacillus phosphorivorans]MQR96934.1 hypothetical protein [Fictibacillus phosphorivorans]
MMKKRPKPWVYTEMVLMFFGLLLAIYNGKIWGNPTVLFSILMVIFIFRAVERKIFNQKTEFWLNTGMATVFFILGILPFV